MDERAKGLWCQEGAYSACHEAYCAHREACPSDLLDALAAREGEVARLRQIVGLTVGGEEAVRLFCAARGIALAAPPPGDGAT